MNERIISPLLLNDNEELKIRPQKFSEFIGQNPLKESLFILIEASKKRQEPLDHILLSGPPGLGKTTIAHIITREMSADIKNASGPSLKAGDLIGILTNLRKGDVFFIDEIHRLTKVIEEILYPAMEDFEVNIVVGDKFEAKPIKISLERFTLIGATTKVGLLSSPFRDRFGFTYRLNLYDDSELIEVVNRSASIFNIPITKDACKEIANRSRGTPRIANRLLRYARDFSLVKGEGEGNITKKFANDAMTLLGIDRFGLDSFDKRILTVIGNDFEGGPVGVKTIAISVGEETRTIEEVYEPYLIHIGFIKRTSQGRVLTEKAKKYLGIKERKTAKVA